MLDIKSLEELTKIEKEALCYRLLVARDDINKRLAEVQELLKKKDSK